MGAFDHGGDGGDASAGGGEGDERSDGGTSGPGPGTGRVGDVSTYRPEDFRREAERFAERHPVLELDFSVESLVRLDKYALGQRRLLESVDRGIDGGDRAFAALRDGYVLRFGSYFGEVLVRRFDGEWEWGEDGVHVTVPVGDFAVDVPVVDAAVAAVEDRPRFAELATDIAETVVMADDDAAAGPADADPGPAGPAGGGGVGDGESTDAGEGTTGGSDPQRRRADRDHPETLREAVAEAASEFVESRPDRDLDYSPEALPRLDDFVEAEWPDDRFADARTGGDRQVDRVYTELIRQLGCYFGETLVRNLDARWVKEDSAAVEVHGPAGGVTVNVFHVADDALTGSPKFTAVYAAARRKVNGGEDGE